MASTMFQGMRGMSGGLVAVAHERLAQRQLVLDAVQAAGDRAGEREVAVRVAAGDAALDACALAVAHLAEAERAVVDAPADAGGRPRAELEPLVAVDRGRPQQAELASRGDLAGEVVLERLAHAVRAVVVVEHRGLAVHASTGWSGCGTTSRCR